MQPVVQHHDAFGVVLALAVHVASHRLNIVRRDFPSEVLGEDGELYRTSPMVLIEDPSTVIRIRLPKETLVELELVGTHDVSDDTSQRRCLPQ